MIRVYCHCPGDAGGRPAVEEDRAPAGSGSDLCSVFLLLIAVLDFCFFLMPDLQGLNLILTVILHLIWFCNALLFCFLHCSVVEEMLVYVQSSKLALAWPATV